MFFLDEVTALAAGHRPCFECRRAAAVLFQAAFAAGKAGKMPLAAEMDAILHGERRASSKTPARQDQIKNLPDAAIVVMANTPMAVCGKQLLPWTASGYGSPVVADPLYEAMVLTPQSILGALQSGYCPRWHASAGRE